MIILVSIVATALVVGTATYLFARRRGRDLINHRIGGRVGHDPVAEHRRMVDSAQSASAVAAERVSLLALALDRLTSGVIVTDEHGQVLLQNRLATTVSHSSHEQTLVEAACSDLLAQARHGVSVEREVEIFGPPPRMLYVHAVPIVDQSDQVVGALAAIDDVTDSHRIDKTRRDFVANLSHELRTPVGAISLLAEMLDGEDDPATRAQLSGRLLLETERVTHTIKDLLELSSIESDDAHTSTEELVAQDLINEAVARTRTAAESKQVEVGVVVATESISIRGNRDQLVSAMVNLVDNAIKYCASGDQVSVRARKVESMLELIVQDTGQGIPARDLDRIFERFYRVDRSRDSTTGGTGIGLSIVRHVALNHGGTVSVDSFDGEGSTFTITIPLVRGQAGAASGSPAAASGSEGRLR